MNDNLKTLIVHAVVGLAVITAVCVLAVTNTISGTQALGAIIGVGGVILGTSSGLTGTLPPNNKPPG